MSEVAASAAQHLIPSAKKVFTDVGHAVMNPSETLEALKQVGQGAYSKASGALGGQRDLKKEQLLDALLGHYGEQYGTMGGFKRALATDPFSVGMDVSVPLTMGAGAGAKAAGLTGKVASLAGALGTAMDPIQASLAVARGVGKGAGAVLRSAQGLATGVSPNLLKVATEAGATTDKNLRDAFLSHLSGRGDPAEIANASRQAINEIKTADSARYLNTRQGLASNSTAIPFDLVNQSFENVRNKYGAIPGAFGPANDLIERAENIVNNFKNLPSDAHRLEGFDNLKQSIWDLRSQTNNSNAQNALNEIYHGVRNSIVRQDPQYAKLMDSYMASLDNIRDLTSGLGGRMATPSAIAKMLKATKTSTGQSLLDQIASTQSGRSIPYMLAGNALHSFTPGGARNLLDAILMYGSVALSPHMAWGLLTSSPRAMGSLNYAIGAGKKYGSPLTGKPTTYGAYQLEGAMGDGQPQAQPTAPQAPIGGIAGAIHQQESGGGRNISTSVTGARGDMQIQPQTFAQYARPGENIDNRQDNINVGHRIIEYYSRRYNGDPARIAVAYFSGPGNVAPPGHPTPWINDRADPTGKTTSSYVNDIIRRLQAGSRAATGGRIERKAGGKVGVDHSSLAANLVRAAELAKKKESRVTEPLLETPDEHIVKALSLANEAI
jgi:hypothetical protein